MITPLPPTPAPLTRAAMTQTPSRVVLAYSGGLDTSVILKWLQQRGHEVVTFTADLGQGEELEPARAKAEMLGVKPEHIRVDDLREEFVADFVMPMMRANAVYEGEYLLGTSIARPLISKRLVKIAREVGADAVAHGATGKGNDQVRFELSAYALAPDIRVIAPWREWDLTSRSKLIEFAEAHQIPIPRDKRGEAPFSTDANLLHTSSEGPGAGGSVGGGAGLCLFPHRRSGHRAGGRRSSRSGFSSAATRSAIDGRGAGARPRCSPG